MCVYVVDIHDDGIAAAAAACLDSADDEVDGTCNGAVDHDHTECCWLLQEEEEGAQSIYY